MASSSSETMDNSGRGKLNVPGFNGIPLDYELPCEDRFAHGFEEWVQVPAVTLKEFSMTATMNLLTDKDQWHEHVHDEIVVAQWKAEVFAKIELMTEQAWTWCLQELRDKATSFAEKGFFTVLETGSCVCKSDTLLSGSFASELRTALLPLIAARQMGENIVDPRAHPLIYGVTPVLSDGGTTKLCQQNLTAGLCADDALTKTAPEPYDPKTDRSEVERRVREAKGILIGLRENGCFTTSPRNYYWSSRYQALPCEASFQSGHKIRIDTYINGLHSCHDDVYQCLEKLLAACIQPWNACIIAGRSGWRVEQQSEHVSRVDGINQRQRGRHPLRIVTYGAEWNNSLPSWAIAFDDGLRDDLDDVQEELSGRPLSRGALDSSAEDDLASLQALQPLPIPDDAAYQKAREYLGLSSQDSAIIDNRPDLAYRIFQQLEAKAWEVAQVHQPEPGLSFTYEDWKSCHNINRAIVPIDDRAGGVGTRSTVCPPTFSPYEVQLEESFADQGLQVIIRIGHLDIPPNEQHHGLWQLQGLLNEHVVATAMYAFDVTNISASIHFRQETPMPGMLYRDDYKRATRWVKEETVSGDWYRYTDMDYGKAFQEVFGLPEDVQNPYLASQYLPVQETGSVELKEGLLVAFPNVLESKLEGTLLDESDHGSLGYVTIQLVDPHYRICSTRNVPRQPESWDESAISGLLIRKGLPDELVFDDSGHVSSGYDARETAAQMKAEIEWATLARYELMDTTSWYDEYA